MSIGSDLAKPAGRRPAKVRVRATQPRPVHPVRGLVGAAGNRDLLRQAYVDTTGHCAFQPSETIAALHALESRITTGRWDDSAEPTRLDAAAAALGEPGRYVRFTPPAPTGALGEPGRR